MVCLATAAVSLNPSLISFSRSWPFLGANILQSNHPAFRTHMYCWAVSWSQWSSLPLPKVGVVSIFQAQNPRSATGNTSHLQWPPMPRWPLHVPFFHWASCFHWAHAPTAFCSRRRRCRPPQEAIFERGDVNDPCDAGLVDKFGLVVTSFQAPYGFTVLVSRTRQSSFM